LVMLMGELSLLACIFYYLCSSGSHGIYLHRGTSFLVFQGEGSRSCIGEECMEL
jgi:hypothetical protein